MGVMVSVRPEDVDLSEGGLDRRWRDRFTPAWSRQGFSRRLLDYQVKVGDVILLSKAHPSLRTPTGNQIHLRMNPEKWVAIQESKSVICHRGLRSQF